MEQELVLVNRKVALMVNNLKRIIKARNMEPLQQKLYEFMHLNCGFIAHYDLNGFKHTYYEGDEFVEFLEHLKDGLSVYGCDEVDNYKYGYTNKEVKEALGQVLTRDLINKIGIENEQRRNWEKRELYLKLKEEFGGE